MAKMVEAVSVPSARLINDDLRGKPISHGFVVTDGEGREVLYSYGTPIATRDGAGKVKLNAAFWAFSKQTGKHRDAFLGETQKDTTEKIKSGEYEVLPFAME